MTTLRFSKFVGAGNDFILVDAVRQRLNGLSRRWPAVSRALCDRRLGIGADGLLVLEPSRRADARMRVFNPDGSEAEMCGNGARCVAMYRAISHQPSAISKRQVTIETRAGVLSATVRGERVSMRMTDPTEIEPDLDVSVGGQRIQAGSIKTGVPHLVVPVHRLQAVDVERLGRALRSHRRFAPRGTNVTFVQPDPGCANRLRVRTYERGVEGETLACGTGVAAAAILHGLTARARAHGRDARYRIAVEARSGDVLTVSFRATWRGLTPRISDVVLEGPARRVFEGCVGWSPHRPVGSSKLSMEGTRA